MNVFLARSTAIELTQLEGHSQTLRALLVAAGHNVEILNLPAISAPGRTLTNLASYRLIGTAASADVLICLDAVSAVLPHPRKLVLLLDDRHLDQKEAHGGCETPAERQYLANVLRASLEEAKEIFVLSSYAAQKLAQLSAPSSRVLSSAFVDTSLNYRRAPGSELLVLNPLNRRQRPDLLVDCLAALPEPFRARWIAPYADPSELLHINALASKKGVDQRLAIDIRQINEGEKGYVISRAAALLELARGMLAGGRDMHLALQAGVPVIACDDGGALADDAVRHSFASAASNGASLARAVNVAIARPVGEAFSLQGPAPELAWAPLMSAVAA